MGSNSHHQPSQATDSPLSSFSSQPRSHLPDPGLNQNTIYNVIHSPDNPPEFYGSNQRPPLQTAGCSHLAKLKQRRKQDLQDTINTNEYWDVFDSYRTLVRYSLSWQKSRKNPKDELKKRKGGPDLPFPQCTTCQDPMARLHVCLHCVYMGCWRKGHMLDHLKEKKHMLAMDFTRRTLYCYGCADYVYDLELEDVIVRQEVIRYEAKSRRKRSRVMYTSWEPTEEEASELVQKSLLISCQGVRGLCNMGNTCFMNVILQSLVHNPLLKAYFLSDRHNPKYCDNKYCMCCEMNNLFKQIYSSEKGPYGPCSFLKSMWMSLKELAGYAQQDAHEFFISALNNIHAGCEGNTMVSCNCIIHKTFAGVLQSNVTCLGCGNVTTTYDPMLDISLGLRPVERKKKTHGPNGTLHQRSGGVDRNGRKLSASSDGMSSLSDYMPRSRQGNTLMDCLDRYTQPEKLGNNEYSCSKCGNTFQEATKQLSVKRMPPVLSFQLKRFEHGGAATKIETKVRFPVELDMTPYTTDGKKDQSSINTANMYTLFAVVNHQGKLDTGHYTMFAKHRGEWFKFDDHSVTMAYQKDVLDSKAYMCFYIKESLEYEDSHRNND
ncbi:hypothetical protein CLU79DRAFT_563267 [Phycomyces nitens]|nr:hypothetical protein CLU79DRAFT_563267 [Phycomyces nitens]